MSASLILCSLVVVASAGYIPPYFGEHGSNYGNHEDAWGGYGAKHGAHSDGWVDGAYGGEVAHKGYEGAGHGAKGYDDGSAYYANAADHAHKGEEYDSGARAASDAEGQKKYSYFTSGSGPQGTYSKGYYGSEGYDHEDSKSGHAKGANGGGFKKGYNAAGAEHHDNHSKYGDAAAAHSSHGDDYKSGAQARKHSSFGEGAHAEGYDAAHHGDGHYTEQH